MVGGRTPAFSVIAAGSKALVVGTAAGLSDVGRTGDVVAAESGRSAITLLIRSSKSAFELLTDVELAEPLRSEVPRRKNSGGISG